MKLKNYIPIIIGICIFTYLLYLCIKPYFESYTNSYSNNLIARIRTYNLFKDKKNVKCLFVTNFKKFIDTNLDISNIDTLVITHTHTRSRARTHTHTHTYTHPHTHTHRGRLDCRPHHRAEPWLPLVVYCRGRGPWGLRDCPAAAR